MKSKGGLAKRYEKSYETRDKGGSGKKDVLDWKKVENDIVFFKPKKGKNSINIIPYIISSPDHPLVKDKTFKIGEQDYLMDLWIHRRVGPTEVDALCLKKNYGKACPICEEASKYYDKGMKDEGKALAASRRVWYNIIDVNDPDKGLQVFSTSHFLFEHELIEEALNGDNGDEMVDFADISDGKVIEFRGAEKSLNKNDYLEYKSFKFVDREEALDESLMDDAISFDSLMVVPTYEELETVLFGGGDEEEAPPARPSKKKPEIDPDESDDEEEEEEEEPKKPAKKVCPEPEKETPKKAAPADPAEYPDCPSGYNFGVDTDEYDECVKCKLYKACATASKKK